MRTGGQGLTLALASTAWRGTELLSYSSLQNLPGPACQRQDSTLLQVSSASSLPPPNTEQQQ